MNQKISLAILAFWILFILVALYLYFFQPAVFYHMTNYKGAGGPFINTP